MDGAAPLPLREATVKALFELRRDDGDRHIKLSGPALTLKTELMRVFVAEAVDRAVQLAVQEGFSELQPEHIEKILPQLLLDFA